MRQLWVDFNEVDKRDHLTSLAEFAEKGVVLALGQTILVGDDDGNLCSALVTDLSDDGLVGLTLDMGTFTQDGARTAVAI